VFGSHLRKQTPPKDLVPGGQQTPLLHWPLAQQTEPHGTAPMPQQVPFTQVSPLAQQTEPQAAPFAHGAQAPFWQTSPLPQQAAPQATPLVHAAQAPFWQISPAAWSQQPTRLFPEKQDVRPVGQTQVELGSQTVPLVQQVP
jgi:hypothetical protein